MNKTNGYKHHPQLLRFKNCKNPCSQIANYLRAIYHEAVRRGYHFNKSKLRRAGRSQRIDVTRGQLDYEWVHLKRKVKIRAPDLFKQLKDISHPTGHPLFRVIAGPVADWEIVSPRRTRLR